MAIKKYFVNTAKNGYQYDRKDNKYFSWGFDVWIGGDRVRERGLPTKQEAENTIAQLKQNARNERLGIAPPVDAPELVALFQRKLDTMAVSPDRARAKRVMKAFLTLLPPAIKVTELRAAHIQIYIQNRTAAGVTASTIRRELVPVVAALHSAGIFFEALESYRPPKIARPKISKTRKSTVITPTNAKAILAWLFDPINDTGHGLYRRTGLFLQICLLTASRPGEIAHLKKSDVDLNSMMLRIEGTKTRFESLAGLRYLNISPTIEKILLERLELTNTEYLFTRGGKVTGKMYDALAAACAANGIKYGKHEPNGITFNRSRHTGITNMIREGIDLQTVGVIVGHSNSTMTMHYAHSDLEAVKQAILVLDKKFERD
jgi:integrase